MNIIDYLKTNRIIADGAMGTYFDHIDTNHLISSEEANIAEPDLIRRIHSSYIKNGASLIRSNTFAANPMAVDALRKKDPQRYACLTLEELIGAGWNLASQAAKDASHDGMTVFPAADIGPIPERSVLDFPGDSADQNPNSPDDMNLFLVYKTMIDVFLEKGAEIFVFETFPEEKYVLQAAEYIRSVKPDAFIIGQYSFNPSGYSRTGRAFHTVLKRSADSGLLDAIGMNCGVGAVHMQKFWKEYFTRYGYPDGVYLSALPNCGYPDIVRGKAVYSDSAVYFGQKMIEIADLGIHIIGGCCGTTPDYIREISDNYKKQSTARKLGRQVVIQQKTSSEELKTSESGNEVLNRARSFREKLLSGEKVWAVELDPPFDHHAEKLITGSALLKDTKADIITVADSPLGKSRADSILSAAGIQNQTGMVVMPHISCRDKNRIAMRGSLLGAHINNIRNVLLVTGDPVGRDERDFTKSVFDYNSIRLMEYVKSMNEDVFLEDPLLYGGALNQGGLNPERIADRMLRKMEAGCSYFMTQPVYSDEGLDRLAWLQKKTGARILIGILPLVSRRNALFIKNEMPGIHVPDEVVDRYPENGTRESWEESALEISLSVIREGKDIGAGYYLMTPFNRAELMKRIMDQSE